MQNVCLIRTGGRSLFNLFFAVITKNKAPCSLLAFVIKVIISEDRDTTHELHHSNAKNFYKIVKNSQKFHYF